MAKPTAPLPPASPSAPPAPPLATDAGPTGSPAGIAAPGGAAAARDRHFGTDHLQRDLKGRAVRGGVVTASSQAVKFVLHFGSTAVLARLLTPADFGLIAMVTAVTGFVALFKDAGLSMATIQRAKITHEQVSTLFWINVALSAGLMLLVAALAPAIAWLYGEPRLVWVTLAIAGTFLFSGFTAQHLALIRRQMRFRTQAVIELLSMAAGIATGITMAAYGFGYWSLVGMAAANPAANCALVWIASGWRPGLPRRRVGTGSMLRFGAHFTGFNAVNYFARNLDNILIGWYWGAAALGVYTRAYALLLKPMTQFNAPISAVTMPALSRVQDQPERFTRAGLRLLRMTATLGCPFTVVVGLFADELIYLWLGPGWEAAIPIVRWLSIVGVVQIATNQAGMLFITQGRADLMFQFGLVNSTLTVLGFVVGLPWGAVGVAAVYAVLGVVIRWPLQYVYLAKTGRFTSKQLYAATAPQILCCIAVIVVALIMRWHPPEGNGEPAAFPVAMLCLLAGFAVVYFTLPVCRQAVRDCLAGLGQRQSSPPRHP